MEKCSCGHKIQSGDNFCADCGKAVQFFFYVCSCGHQQDGGNRYCVKCGEITTFGMMTSLWDLTSIKEEKIFPKEYKKLLNKFSSFQRRA